MAWEKVGKHEKKNGVARKGRKGGKKEGEGGEEKGGIAFADLFASLGLFNV